MKLFVTTIYTLKLTDKHQHDFQSFVLFFIFFLSENGLFDM